LSVFGYKIAYNNNTSLLGLKIHSNNPRRHRWAWATGRRGVQPEPAQAGHSPRSCCWCDVTGKEAKNGLRKFLPSRPKWPL